ncbi:hypothetical protein MtrunA17_Chr4g0060491 [Medicago truncatula]|uniref:Transmembrane protein n=1 Tax=Medicago truncatula TaxID=3880 RepID=A0A396IFR1_MEDTR|nr:hypothetical protein MtrunA17_Chr4g0060491 [Medicago truncatula]
MFIISSSVSMSSPLQTHISPIQQSQFKTPCLFSPAFLHQHYHLPLLWLILVSSFIFFFFFFFFF